MPLVYVGIVIVKLQTHGLNTLKGKDTAGNAFAVGGLGSTRKEIAMGKGKQQKPKTEHNRRIVDVDDGLGGSTQIEIHGTTGNVEGAGLAVGGIRPPAKVTRVTQHTEQNQ